MARQKDIEQLLRDVAPLFLDIAERAQQAAAALEETEWARTNLPRTAAVHQVSGTARWRITGDGIVSRESELPAELELSSCDKEQNQGRYYLRAPHVAVVLTVRRKPHRDDEQPNALQMQLQEVLEHAPVAFEEQIVVYLAVPSLGHAPTFEVATRGKETISYRLVDLIDNADEMGDVAVVHPLPKPPARGPKVTSTRESGQEEGATDSPG
jgi:hypothetical protein